MSSGYAYGGLGGDFAVPSRGEAAASGDKKLKRILALIALVLGAELVWLFGISPCMPLSRASVSGIPGIDEAAVLALAGIGSHSSYMTVNAQAAEEALMALPLIRSARVLKQFPNRVEIILESRRPAAMVFVSQGERVYPALIDGDGMIFTVGKEGFREDETLPVISGLVLEGVYPGMKLPRIYNGLFSKLEKLARETPELLAVISEIRINSKNYEGYDLTLFPAHRGVRVRVGEDVGEETLRYMLLMLDVLSAKSRGIDEIDFRTGTASYRIKEAYSG
ncbi:MAG: FtsQ-type POTRA domain-containing protein [Treponema sp.]|jgi:cell division protein FtsQ|nr:FtsQ-type POTRA domain-containing protein [Treponema sp.]